MKEYSIEKTTRLVDEKLSKADIIDANNWMQLRSLITHIKHMTNNLVPPEDKSQRAVMVRFLVNCFVRFSYHFYAAFCKSLEKSGESEAAQQRRDYHQHQAIERLCGDWETLRPLLYSVKNPHTGVLNALIRAAKPSENYWRQRWESWDKAVAEEWRKEWETWKADTWGEEEWEKGVITLPYLGRDFKLVTFEYAPYIAVLGMPLYNLETPWDWHVVWHEMAGRVVHHLEHNDSIPVLPEDVWETWGNKYCEAPEDTDSVELPAASSDTTGAPDEMPTGMGLIEETIDRAGWVAELLEDAYGFISLGPAMVRTLERVLRQHYKRDDVLLDDRHPPPQLRLDMAGAILLEMAADPEIDLDVGQELLKQLGLKPKDCESLRPVAKKLYMVLVGDSQHPGYVTKFEPTMMDEDEANTLKTKLKKGEVASGSSIPDLIAASRLALEESPGKGIEIAKAMEKTIEHSSPQVSQMPDEIDLPPKGLFTELFAGKDWGELLAELYYEEDAAQTRTVHVNHHDASDENCLLWPIKIHGTWHRLYHYTRRRSHIW
jgi:hypothetical protein